MKIWKYRLPMSDFRFTAAKVLSVPQQFKPLCVQIDQKDGCPCVWAEVGEDEPNWKALIHVVGTGQYVPKGDLSYIGTTQIGGYVWHYYYEDCGKWKTREEVIRHESPV